jgi:hypothetical protein
MAFIGYAGRSIMSSYNLFRSRERSELICAVPEHLVVPAFITDAQWEFACKADDMSASNTTFDHTAAEVGIRYNGFYLFQSIGIRDNTRCDGGENVLPQSSGQHDSDASCFSRTDRRTLNHSPKSDLDETRG